MKVYSVKYSSEAVGDLIAIYNYIANEQIEPTNATNLTLDNGVFSTTRF